MVEAPCQRALLGQLLNDSSRVDRHFGRDRRFLLTTTPLTTTTTTTIFASYTRAHHV
jgi:hypothetical protein